MTIVLCNTKIIVHVVLYRAHIFQGIHIARISVFESIIC